MKGKGDFDMKKLISLLLVTAIMLCMTFSVSAESDTVILKALNYNVKGLPSFTTDVGKNQKAIGKHISENGYDIAAVQEDFGKHRSLVSALPDYKYKTHHTGYVPGGDGMNIFTKSMPLYNETRVTWNDAYGIIDNGADALTPKGILYTVIDIGNGIYIDFYVIHADAFGDEGSIAAREKNFAQLYDFITENSEFYDRPVIVTGDFNVYSHSPLDSKFNYYFHENAGFKDAWTEQYNNGDYKNYSSWYSLGDPWGKWNSVEKFLYRDGGGVTVTASSFEYLRICDENGQNLSDHVAAVCNFTFTKTENFVPNTQELSDEKPYGNFFTRQVVWFFSALKLILSNFEELKAFLETL